MPAGTQVVTRVAGRDRDGTDVPPGTPGRIEQSPLDPSHSYGVRFLGGGLAFYRRDELAMLRHFHARDGGQPPDPLLERGLRGYVIYRCVIGSRAYGLHHDDSDHDRRGIYLPPAELHWSLAGVPEQLEDATTQDCYWELQKFLVLALKANPSALECLWTPLIEHATPLARELLAMRDAFLSRLAYQTYCGYVMSQWKKLERDVANHGAPRWKHAMHLLRLLYSGIELVRDGVVRVDVGEHEQRLLAVRAGQVPWDELVEWQQRLQREFDAAFAATRLPERPDYARVDAFLLRARRGMVSS